MTIHTHVLYVRTLKDLFQSPLRVLYRSGLEPMATVFTIVYFLLAQIDKVLRVLSAKFFIDSVWNIHEE